MKLFIMLMFMIANSGAIALCMTEISVISGKSFLVNSRCQ